MNNVEWIKNLIQKKPSQARFNSSKPSKDLLEKKLSVCTFYHYQEINPSRLSQIKKNLLESPHAQDIRGLILLSSEGINATLTGKYSRLEEFVNLIQEQTGISIQARWQFTPIWGFKKLRVKIKNEIVHTGKKDGAVSPLQDHLTANQWKEILESGSRFFILDIRNDYEVDIGKFEGAFHLNLKKFQNFAEELKNHKIPKDAHVLIYCTGGIRCEKALVEMRTQGFQKVSLLKGGILSFLAQFPNTHFKGDCFVFDHRVSLNQELLPSGKYSLCPHCGQPGNKEIHCQHCNHSCRVCERCFESQVYYQTCSKNCSYHFQKGHKFKQKDKKSEL